MESIMVSENALALNNRIASDKKQNVNFQFGIFPPMEVSEIAAENHSIEFNVGRSLTFSHFSQGYWQTNTCNHGNMISLLSPGLREKIKWSGELSFLRITFS